MSNYKFNVDLPSGVSLAESATRIVNHLKGQGYEVKSQNLPSSATLERSGSYLSMKDHRGPHELRLQFSQSGIVFDFKVASFWKDAPSSGAFSGVVERAKEEIVRRCPSCAEYVRSDAKVCRFCQRSI